MSGDLCTETGVTHKSRRSYFSPDGRVCVCVCVWCYFLFNSHRFFARFRCCNIIYSPGRGAPCFPSVSRGKKPSNNSAPPERFETQGSTKIQNKMIKYAKFVYVILSILPPRAQTIHLMTMVFFVYCPRAFLTVAILLLQRTCADEITFRVKWTEHNGKVLMLLERKRLLISPTASNTLRSLRIWKWLILDFFFMCQTRFLFLFLRYSYTVIVIKTKISKIKQTFL